MLYLLMIGNMILELFIKVGLYTINFYRVKLLCDFCLVEEMKLAVFILTYLLISKTGFKVYIFMFLINATKDVIILCS